MATTGGANIAVDGLVFGYDTGYPLVSGSSDTYKFNRGEPTENVIAGTNLIYTVSGTYITDTTVDGVRILENNQVNNSHVMWNSATGFIITCSSGAYITVSAEYKTDCTIRMRFRDNPYDAQYDIDGGNIATISEQGVDFNTNGEWKRYSLTAQTATANPDLWWYLVDYRTNNEFGRVEIRNWQIEVKSHATPFTTGTRSASGSLIDLTRTSNIDLSNVSFDSNAQMTFDGTDDYIESTTNLSALTDLSEGTVEVIFKWDSRDTTTLIHLAAGNSFYGMNLGLGNWTGGYPDESVYFYIFDVDGNNLGIIYYRDGHLKYRDGKYHHLVLSESTNNGVKLYIDGNPITVGGNISSFTPPTVTKLQIGKRDYGPSPTNHGGDIPVVKIYNRALTAQEVLQNYNAVKERFSL